MLTNVLEKLDSWDQQFGTPIVVFDLDSTLFDTAARHLRILKEFAKTESGELCDIVETVTLNEFNWSVVAPLIARGVTDVRLHERLMTFWFSRFFTDEYVQADEPSPGAVEFVSLVHRRGGLVYYLTGRDVPNMGAGTASALTSAGFPLWRGRTVLHLKPLFKMADKPFKAEAVNDINSHKGVVVATFDNEPENCNLFQASFPEALNFIVGSVHSPDPVSIDPRVIAIADFRLSPA